MDNYLDSLFESFSAAARDAQAKDDKYIIIDKVCEYLDELAVYPFAEVLAKILALIEAFPQLDYGGPGPFGTLIEQHRFADYTPALLASIGRQPSTQVIGWLDRTMMVEDFQNGQGKNPVTPLQFAQCLRETLSGSQAATACKAFADICLKDLVKRGLIDV